MTGEWVWLVNPVNGLPHRVTNDRGVIASQVGRGLVVTDLPGELDSDDPDFIELFEKRKASEQASELRGKELDAALDSAGLSKSGTVDEKRARLADFEASQETVEAESATSQEGTE